MRRFKRCWFIAGALLLPLLICGALVLLRSREGRVTVRLQTTAEFALDNPASAAINLNHTSYPAWFPPNGSDYAVHDEMVIFPQPPNNSIKATFQNVSPDKTMPALVYAPDGRSLPAGLKPGILDDRSWAYMGEWFLYGCRPVADHAGWWRCQLLVGGNI